MKTRLETKYPDLAQAILEAPSEKRMRIVRAAGRVAAKSLQLDRVLGEHVLAFLDGVGVLDGETKARLERLQQESDARYLDVLDSLATDEALPKDAMEAFKRARALAAILGIATDVDAATATDVVYETLASGADDDEVLATIRGVVQQ